MQPNLFLDHGNAMNYCILPQIARGTRWTAPNYPSCRALGTHEARGTNIPHGRAGRRLTGRQGHQSGMLFGLCA